MKFSIATNWDNNLIDYFADINNDYLGGNQVYQVFASQAFSILGSANTNVPDISRSEIKSKVEYLQGRQIHFNYLLNASKIPNLQDKNIKEQVLAYLSWISTLKPDIITVANEDLIKIISDNFPELKINISIVYGLKDIEKVNYLRERYPNIYRITLHQDINRDKNLLNQHIQNAHNHSKFHPVEVELLANEICFLGCKVMKDHYDALTSISQKKGNGEDFLFGWCCRKRKSNIIDFINSSFIRPEDIKIYADMGVDIIKLAGRKESSMNLKKRVTSYMKEYHSGNIMDLFLSEFWPNNKPPFIDNRIFDGFLDFLWEQEKTRITHKSDYTKFANLDYIWN